METKEETSPEQVVKGPRNTKLTVVVEASKLYGLPPTEPNVDLYTALEGDDGFGSDFGDRNKNFETKVFLNYKMSWDIKTSDKNGVDRGYSVGLYSVYHNPVSGNPNFFNSTEILSKNNGNTVEATVVNAPILPGMDENYTIYFWVKYGNGLPTYFPLDPKLKINT